MNHTRKKKPLWRWEAFLFALVLVLAIAASFVSKAAWPVVGPILSIVLLVLAIAAALLLIVPLLLPNGRDSEGTRKTLDGITLLPMEPTDAIPATTHRVEESRRRQTSIDAARAKTHGPQRAVLTPDASRWLGRELRVAVDLIDDDGVLHRAGFVPSFIDADLDARLQPLTAQRAAALVDVVINGTEQPFTVDVRLGALPAER